MVYIQSDSDRKLPHHFDCAAALYGALDWSQDIRLTSMEEVQSGKFDMLIRQHLFVGSVEFMTEVFSRINKQPQPLPPAQEMVELTISEVIERIKSKEKLFVKPLQTKLFTGMVFDTLSIGILQTFPDTTPVWVTKPISSQIMSEWRLYIQDGKIVDARNYSGDFKIMPNWFFCLSTAKELVDFPSCYTLDVAVLSNNETMVIEYNDMFAIGNYGMENSLYYKLLRQRYFEIVR